MKITRQLSISSIAIIISLSGCGDFKVKADIDDKDIAAISDIFASDDSNDDLSSSDSTTSEDTNSSSTSSSDSNSDTTTSSEATTVDYGAYDQETGLIYTSDSNNGMSRSFLGTYSKGYSSNDCSEDYWGPGLEMPAVLRAYSYGDYIDFETSLSQLVWSAIVYQDNTFDFVVRYLDSLGKPSITLTCTCSIVDSYYYSDHLDCTCDPSNDTDVCELRYNLM